jgi:hypothetical protein
VRNGGSIARSVVSYDNSEVHHVLELSLLYNGAGGATVLRTDPVSRLLFYAQTTGLFDLNGAQNALVLLDNAALASSLGTAIHNGSHVSSYADAIRQRIGAVFIDELAVIGSDANFNAFLQTGRLPGLNASQLTEFNAAIADGLGRTTVEFS